MPRKKQTKSKKTVSKDEKSGEENVNSDFQLRDLPKAKEELKKQKTELVKIFVKDKMIKEEKMARLNEWKIMNAWRELMRITKSGELRSEIDIIRQYYERIFAQKNDMISSLSEQIKVDEDSWQKVVHSCFKNIDELIEVQSSRVENLNRNFEEEIKQLKSEFDEEMQLIQEKSAREIENEAEFLSGIELKSKEELIMAEAKYDSYKQQLEKKNNDELKVLLTEKESIVENLTKQLKAVEDDYEQRTSDLQMAHARLKLKDDRDNEEIDKLSNEMKDLQESIADVKLRINDMVAEKETFESSLKLKEKMGVTNALKNETRKECVDFRNSLKNLSMDSGEAIKVLSNTADKLRKVIRLNDYCMQLEMKGGDMGSSLLSNSSRNYEELSEPMAEDMFPSLHNLWKRYNKAASCKSSLEKNNRELIRRNTKLKSEIQKYVTENSRGAAALRQNIPLNIESFDNSYYIA